MPKIDIFTNHYYPENFRINEISEFLAKENEVKVVTQIPNYPSGSFFDGYSIRNKRKERLGNIKVERLAVIPRGSNSIMLLLNYISYIISSFFYGVFSKTNPDYVFVYITSPIFIAWSGLKIAKRKKVPSTLYLLDLWPGVLFTMLKIKNKSIKRFFEKMTINIYKRFDHIIVSSYSFIEVLESYGIEKEKIQYIPQHAEEVSVKPERPQHDKIEIIFTGNIGEAQGLDILVETAILLKETNIGNVKFKIVGDGRYKETLENRIDSENLSDYFEFTGRVDADEIPSLLNQADFGFVSLVHDETLSKTLPAKVQTYMAHGIPILASANGEIPWILEQSQAGLCAPAGNTKKLYEQILHLLQMTQEDFEKFSLNGYTYSKKHFSKMGLFREIQNIIYKG